MLWARYDVTLLPGGMATFDYTLGNSMGSERHRQAKPVPVAVVQARVRETFRGRLLGWQKSLYVDGHRVSVQDFLGPEDDVS